MRGPRVVADQEIRAWTLSGARVAIAFDAALYPPAAVARAAYRLTDRAWTFLARDGADVIVSVAAKDPRTSLENLVGELAQAALDEVLRLQLEAEASEARAAILDHAFRFTSRA